jgi:2-aminoadipate transaminase
MGLNKRKRLIEFAARHDLLIVEDDPYGDLFFGDRAGPADTRPIKADDKDGRVIYLSSFSKTLAPGFRVAWIAAPRALAAKFELAKQAADLCTGGLDQRIVYEAWRRGVLARIAPGLREHYQTKRDAMEAALRREVADLVSWPEPRGGFFIWMSFPPDIDADAMLERATAEKVIYVAGSAFFVEDAPGNLARFSFSHPTTDRIVQGVGRFKAALLAEIEAHRAVRGL